MSLSYESAISSSSSLFSFSPSPSSFSLCCLFIDSCSSSSSFYHAVCYVQFAHQALCSLLFSLLRCFCFNFTSWVDEVDVSECTRAPLLKCAVCSAERRDLFLFLSLLSAFSHESNYSRRRRRVPPMPPQYRSLIIIHTQAGRHFIHFYTPTQHQQPASPLANFHLHKCIKHCAYHIRAPELLVDYLSAAAAVSALQK